MTLRREHPAAGFFWIGACLGNRAGSLNAAECKLPLLSSEVVGAGYATPGEIPPVKGSGIEIKLAGKGKGKVTGRVLNGGKTLACDGAVCRMTGPNALRLRQPEGAGRWGAAAGTGGATGAELPRCG